MSKWKKVGRVVGIVGLIVGVAMGLVWYRLSHPPKPAGPPIQLPPILKVEDLTEDNACYWFIKATEKVVWPDTSQKEINPKVRELLGTIDKVLSEGWEGDYPDIQELLSKNAEALSLLERGLTRAKAQMPTIKDPGDYPVSFLRLRSLAQMEALRGRKAEAAGDEKEAIRYFLDGVRFGYHIQRGLPVDFSFFGVSAKVISAKCLLRGLRARRFQNVEALREAAAELDELRKLEPPVSDVFRYELVSMEGFFKGLASSGQGAASPGQKAPQGFWWKSADIFDVLEAHSSEPIKIAEEPYPVAIPKFDKVERKRQKAGKHTWATMLKEGPVAVFAYVFEPDWGRSFEVLRRGTVAMAMIEVAVALEVQRLEKGTYPETVSELVPEYIPEVPPDFFTMKPLTYRKTETGYILYSFGLDMDDDGGKIHILGLLGERTKGVKRQLLFPPDGVIEVEEGDIVVEVK